MMLDGIVGAFRQRRVAHNRASRPATKADVPLETPPLVLGAVRGLADIPIMHRRVARAKRSLVRSAIADTSHYTDHRRRQFNAWDRRPDSKTEAETGTLFRSTPSCGLTVIRRDGIIGGCRRLDKIVPGAVTPPQTGQADSWSAAEPSPGPRVY